MYTTGLSEGLSGVPSGRLNPFLVCLLATERLPGVPSCLQNAFRRAFLAIEFLSVCLLLEHVEVSMYMCLCKLPMYMYVPEPLGPFGPAFVRSQVLFACRLYAVWPLCFPVVNRGYFGWPFVYEL